MAKERRTPAGETAERSKRIPIKDSKDILTVEGKDPDYNYRWVNDIKAGIRLNRFLQAGYEFEDVGVQVGDVKVADPEGMDSKVSKIVGVDEKTGLPIHSYLMKIKKHWYEEDQKAKMDDIREAERGIFRKRGLTDDAYEDSDGYYGEGLKRGRTI